MEVQKKLDNNNSGARIRADNNSSRFNDYKRIK
jgi:hypothetical protein